MCIHLLAVSLEYPVFTTNHHSVSPSSSSSDGRGFIPAPLSVAAGLRPGRGGSGNDDGETEPDGRGRGGRPATGRYRRWRNGAGGLRGPSLPSAVAAGPVPADRLAPRRRPGQKGCLKSPTALNRNGAQRSRVATPHPDVILRGCELIAIAASSIVILSAAKDLALLTTGILRFA